MENANAREKAEMAQVRARLVPGLDLPELVAPSSHRLDLESIINRACGGGRRSSSTYTRASELLDDVSRFVANATTSLKPNYCPELSPSFHRAV